MKGRKAYRLPLFLSPALLLVAACGVPISAEEVSATAESQRTSQQLSTIGDAAVSSRSASGSVQDARFSGTPSPVSTLSALTTGTPGASVTPDASSTPGPSPTPGQETATPTPTSTGEASLLAAGTTATVTVTGTPPTATPTATPSAQPTAGVPTSDFGAQVVNLVNDYRVSRGLGRLKPDPYITTASNNYAKLMGTNNVFGHNGPDGSSSEGRLKASGYPGAFCGENIAAGQTSPQEALNVWKNSPAHNAIMLAANPADVGVGYFYIENSTYKHYWVLMTGRSGEGCPAG